MYKGELGCPLLCAWQHHQGADEHIEWAGLVEVTIFPPKNVSLIINLIVELKVGFIHLEAIKEVAYTLQVSRLTIGGGEWHIRKLSRVPIALCPISYIALGMVPKNISDK